MSYAKFLEPVFKSLICKFSSIVTDQDSGYAMSCHYIVHKDLLYSGGLLGEDGDSFCPSCKMVGTYEKICATTLVMRKRSNQVYTSSVEGCWGCWDPPSGLSRILWC